MAADTYRYGHDFQAGREENESKKILSKYTSRIPQESLDIPKSRSAMVSYRIANQSPSPVVYRAGKSYNRRLYSISSYR